MSSFRHAWSAAGVVAGLAGLATSYAATMAMTIRSSPITAVAELIIRKTPGAVAEKLISIVGTRDKPLLVLGTTIFLLVMFAYAGRLAQRTWWAPAVVYVALAAVGVVAALSQSGATTVDVIPVALGFVTWLVVLSLITEPLRRLELAETAPLTGPAPAAPDTVTIPDRDRDPDRGPNSGLRPGGHAHDRRQFVIRVGIFAAGAAAVSLVGRFVGAPRRHVEESRKLLRLDQVSLPKVPVGARVDVEGVTPWMTPADDFYRIDTTIVTPAIEPSDWSLRIHGMVDREITLTYDDLMRRTFTEGWVTLNCVSNEVGGDLIGNAWWSGVRIAEILAEAGIQEGADAVLQTSDDGWTCATPIEALTDDRNAMLAVAMNGRPLPIDHGFPVRSVVPGLYGYVSATKWVREFEVTRFDDVDAYWTQRGWGELGPVKMSSRIDVPRSGADVDAGEVVFAGVAWAQHTGIQAVEFAVDGGAWVRAEIAKNTVTNDSWVQWRGVATVEAGQHIVRVRATDKTGLVQTGTVQDVLPDGATGWDGSDFNAS